MDKLFLVDSDTKISFNNLFGLLNKSSFLKQYVYTDSFSMLLIEIIKAILYKKSIILLDADFSTQELHNLGIKTIDLDKKYKLDPLISVSGDNFLEILQNNNNNWSITLFTSGTMGLPKKVDHSFNTLTRTVKIDENKCNNIWGFAYNPTHIAGLQVFFQALLNQNTIVNIFNKNRQQVLHSIKKYKITNISATPTFFRMLLPFEEKYLSVQRITFGGEKFDENLNARMLELFPNSKILNIYASTEAGTVLATKGGVFEISNKNSKLVKIVNNELFLHSSLFYLQEEIELKNGWYPTGDIVKVISNEPLKFMFINRKNEMINVGGYKVNPIEVESIINSHENVVMSKVYLKKNSIVGNLIVADVVVKEEISEKDLRIYLTKKLQSYKVPRIISFVKEIALTRTGKLKRS